MNKTNRNSFKIAFDMTFVQLGWALWIIGISLIIFVGMRYFPVTSDYTSGGFFSLIENPYKIFMLVIGILSVPSFLSYYVKLGVTRKHYFTGAAISAAGLSAIFMIIAVMISGIEQLVEPTDVVTFLGVNASWILIFMVFSLNIFVYYIAGWLIGAGFYRYNVWAGFLFIIGAIALIFMMDFLWSGELNTPLHSLLSIDKPQDLSLGLSFGVTFVLIAISLWIIRRVTKRVRVKM